MFRYVALSVVFCVGLEVALADTGYAYHYKVIQFYADLLSQMEKGTECKIEGFNKMMQNHSKFSKAMREYASTIAVAQFKGKNVCSASEETKKLQTINKAFNTSSEECIAQADCKSDLAAETAKIITLLQDHDADTYKQAIACSDDACKRLVYHNTHESLLKLYEEHMPTLRVMADQSMSNTKCSSAFIQCMIGKNTDNLKQMYTSIAKLEDCIASGGNRKTSVVNTSSYGGPPTSGGWYSNRDVITEAI